MVTVIPFLWLRDGTHPLAARTCDTPASSQARQIRPAAPVGALKTWGPADKSLSRQPERRRPIRRSGRDPGPRRYARTGAKPRKQGRGREHYPHPPCRLFAALSARASVRHQAQIVLFWVPPPAAGAGLADV